MQTIKLVLSKLPDLMLQAKLALSSIWYKQISPLLSPLLLLAFFNHDFEGICKDRGWHIYGWADDNEQYKSRSAVVNSVQIQDVQIHNILIIVL